MQEIEDFKSSDLKPAEEIKERIDSPTEEQIHNERLNRELIQEESNENQSTEPKAEVTDDRERTSSGDSSSKFFAEIVFTKKNLNFFFIFDVLQVLDQIRQVLVPLELAALGKKLKNSKNIDSHLLLCKNKSFFNYLSYFIK